MIIGLFGKLNIWEVATWEITLGKLPLGKNPLGKYVTSQERGATVIITSPPEKNVVFLEFEMFLK